MVAFRDHIKTLGMNKNIVNNETELLCYRLRTPRQRKRAVRDEFDRKLRAFDREQRELWKKEGELGWIELNPPVMRGWKRFYVLRPDVSRSKDASFFQAILDKINTVDYSSRKDFKVKYRSQGKKQHYIKDQRLKYLAEAKTAKAVFSEKELQLFEHREVLDWTGKKFIPVMVFTEQWHFVLRTRPNFITKTRARNELIESRISEIENYFERNYLRERLKNIKGIKNYWHSEMWEEKWRKERHQFKNMSLLKMLDAIKEEQI